MDFYSHKPLANEVAAISRMGQADKGRRDAQCDMASRVTCIMHQDCEMA